MSPGGAPEISTEPPRRAEEELGESRSRHDKGRFAITLAALGIVFGDIGTSPLYAMHTVFAIDRQLRPTEATVYGVISLVFWAITLVVSVKYVTLIMRADNHGEGGIMALIALVRGIRVSSRSTKLLLVSLGIFGAALFYGDGMITPAISVLAAVEGLEVASPGVASLVIPVTLTILSVLFAVQRFGTGLVGRAFGPVMGLWFGILAVSGLVHVLEHPGILRALSPHYGAVFLAENGWIGFLALGAVVLAITGAEALYADMGHFGHDAIRRAWFFVVFPALTLNYMGQGTLILGDPGAVDNPFFLLFPHWLRMPMVIVATVAAIIASQAVISGAFSVTRQAVQLGFLPRLTVLHTSREIGQVYVPVVNWALFTAVAALVLGFGSSAHLASAYGIAVTGTLAIDTLLFFFVVRELWHKPKWLAVAGCAFFLTIDLAFFGANLPKVLHGGWFPLVIAAIIFAVLVTWQNGQAIVMERRRKLEGPLRSFVEEVRERGDVIRSPRTGVFFTAHADNTPLALRANLEHNTTVHETVIVVSLEPLNVPHVQDDERLKHDDLGYEDDGICHVTARYGFQDDIDIPGALRGALKQLEGDVDLDHVSYFISRATIVVTDEPGMARWRKKLFAAIARNAANPVAYFGLPDERTVVMGAHIEL
ncbi:MAG TPA: potassium transporter Kup [Solirubrobacteraceae bacterium]|nr:potassium transporter Kup [Solirubrobacteraceae bacterium]